MAARASHHILRAVRHDPVSWGRRCVETRSQVLAFGGLKTDPNVLTWTVLTCGAVSCFVTARRERRGALRRAADNDFLSASLLDGLRRLRVTTTGPCGLVLEPPREA